MERVSTIDPALVDTRTIDVRAPLEFRLDPEALRIALVKLDH